MGDGMLAQFNSALEAVQCALEIQEMAHSQLEVKLRIGIHLGDITIENEDIFGDGVNIASRLQAVADPGSIYVSEATAEAVGRKKDITFHFLGELQLKNVDHPVNTYYLKSDWLTQPSRSKIKSLLTKKKPLKKIYLVGGLLLITLIIIGWWYFGRTEQEIGAVAVLPVTNMTGDPSKDILLAGLHSGIRDEIASIRTIRVPSRTTTNKYQNSNMSIPEIARELGVDALIEIDLYETGDRTRLQARLIKAFPEEVQLWGEMFEKATMNILSIYDEIALAVARESKIDLSENEVSRFSTVQTIDPEAYQAYLTGMNHMYTLSREGISTALEYFEKSLAIDSSYAPTWAAIAWTWAVHVGQGIAPSREVLPKVEKAMTKAVELDSTLAEIRYVLATIYTWNFWNWEKAEEEFQNTFEIDPNHVEALAFYSHYLNIMNRKDESSPYIEKALKLEPYNTLVQSLYGMHLNHTRQYSKAMELLNNTLDEDPDNVLALPALWTIYHNGGMYEEALEVAAKLYKAIGEERVYEELLEGYRIGGYKTAMDRVAKAFTMKKDSTFHPAWRLATLYMRADNKPATLYWLEKAYEEHDINVTYLSVDPIFDPIDQDPHFQEILRKLNLIRVVKY
jgi:TolB-like protein/Tfp pilus assembly protein PilF